jgi:hypothetical protein
MRDVAIVLLRLFLNVSQALTYTYANMFVIDSFEKANKR